MSDDESSGDSDIRTTSWAEAPRVDPALILHSWFVVPAKASINTGAKPRVTPAPENQLGRDVASLAEDGDKNHEEDKVEQGASTIDCECRSTLL